MEIGALEIHDALAFGVFYEGVSDAPFLRDRPIEHWGPGRELVALDGDMPRKHIDRSANSLSGDAPADWKDLGCEVVNFPPDGVDLDRADGGRSLTHGTIIALASNTLVGTNIGGTLISHGPFVASI